MTHPDWSEYDALCAHRAQQAEVWDFDPSAPMRTPLPLAHRAIRVTVPVRAEPGPPYALSAFIDAQFRTLRGH